MSSPAPPRIRVLIVDDTVIYRKVLARVVGELPHTEVVAAEANGLDALARLAREPVDLVLLDIIMPGMDGLETLRHIRARFPEVAVVMVSDMSREVAATVRALEMGALEFVQKPQGMSLEENKARLVRGLQPILQMVAARRDHRPRHPPAPGAPRVAPAGPRQAPDLVLIGTSTGGPNALARIIPQLPAALPAPVLVVQHMPPLFTSSLAEQLARKSAVAVREARHGEPLAPGTVLLAPGGRHMTVAAAPDARGPRDWQVQINDDPPVNSCRPSVDVLFQSVAAQARAAVVSVIMTGMGADGLDGVARLKRRHGYVLAQDADSCVVYGMSRAVIEKGLADEVLPLDRIGARIVELLQPEPAA